MRLCLALLLASLPAFSAVPEKGEGDITFFGGLRSIFPANNTYLNEQGASHQPLQFGGMASFGYQYDDELHFKIELGYMIDRYKIAGGDLLFAMDTALWRGKAFTLYGGGGIGYSLNTGTRGGVNNEANSTAAYVGIGLRLQISGPLAVVFEDRWTLASAQVDAGNSKESLNVGGNFFSVGLVLHFLQPEEKSFIPPGGR